MIKVRMISKDGQKFSYRSDSNDKEQAIQEAKNCIVKNGWERYEYKLYETIEESINNEILEISKIIEMGLNFSDNFEKYNFKVLSEKLEVQGTNWTYDYVLQKNIKRKVRIIGSFENIDSYIIEKMED